ncbi:hypothetical protein WI80_00465 [Burkholderia ubonensis]|uniref:hypothetical protein n=1 Tax=Burkholderia TaxID=32008 RepID=UPI0005AD1A34|nr:MULTISPECIES: hypothetical protein [Burkholderia]KIP17019.1 hypothetical protein KY49_6981 [Burkholderia sp. MSHR3999]KVD16111.1 hypothetical protein WI80_00465 [Burkholderia ubonensis]KVU24979.1 hypothetical protein WK63_25755 [Burkholderia ubonensis]
MSTLTYQRLTARAERTILRLVVENREHAIGALELWEDLVTELNAFGRTIYEADRVRLQALIYGDDMPAT